MDKGVQTMTRSPVLSKAQRKQIISVRECATGSIWDDKIHPGYELTYYDLRYKVGEAVVRGKKTIREVSQIFNVSIGFVSKWSKIFRARDDANQFHGQKKTMVTKQVFKSISNCPKNIQRPVQDKIRDVLVPRRKKYDFEGAFRLKEILHLEASPTTINKVLRSEGLMDEPKKRHVNKVYGRFQRPWTLRLVQTDYKSWNILGNNFKTIWILDDCTRMILAHRVVLNSSAELVIELLQEVIDTYGKPDQILSDHGTEFYSISSGKGKSKFDKFCKENGVEHIMGRVRHPQTQGKMERTHRTASEEVLSFGTLDTFENAKKAFARWIEYYNWERPHQALDYATPGAAFTSMHSLDLDELMAV